MELNSVNPVVEIAPHTTQSTIIDQDQPVDQQQHVQQQQQQQQLEQEQKTQLAQSSISVTQPQLHSSLDTNSPSSKLERKQLEKLHGNKREELGKEPLGTTLEEIEDEKLFTMLRNFNFQINQVLSPPSSLPPNQPDLRRSTLPTIPFNSDTLNNNAKRLYASFGVPMIIFGRELMRLMDWDFRNGEGIRTSLFCTSYFIACYFSLVIPVIFSLLILLVVFPASRAILFPSPPTPFGVVPSALDPTNKAGDESLLPSSTSATSATKTATTTRSKSEQIEQQASEVMNFGSNFLTKILVGGKNDGQGNGKVGKKEGESNFNNEDVKFQDQESKESNQKLIPVDASELSDSSTNTTTSLLSDSSNRSTAPDGTELTEEQIKKNEAKEVKIKRDALINEIAKGLQDGLGDTADLFERLNNSFNPPRVYYPSNQSSIKIASLILLPIVIITSAIPAHIWSQLISFVVGFGFFFNKPLYPIGVKGLELFKRLVPDWRDKLDLRNSILSGVPTDAQVILHILRTSELSYQPLPSAPAPPKPPQHIEAELSKPPSLDSGTGTSTESSEMRMNESGEIVSAEEHAAAEAAEQEGEEDGMGKKVVKKSKGKILGLLKTTAGKVAKFGADVRDTKEDLNEVEEMQVEEEKVEEKEKLGRRGRIGNAVDKLFYKSKAEDDGTPESYPAKLDGTSGHILITHIPSHKPSTVSFIPLKSETPTFSAPISNLIEIKKSGISIARTALGWAADLSLEGMGLELRFKESNEIILEEKIGLGNKEVGVGGEEGGNSEIFEGKVWNFEHVGRRDQLFCRLLAIGGQKWESL